MAHTEQAATLMGAPKVNHTTPPVCVGGPRRIRKVVLLASLETVWVNGQVVRVNGGIG